MQFEREVRIFSKWLYKECSLVQSAFIVEITQKSEIKIHSKIFRFDTQHSERTEQKSKMKGKRQRGKEEEGNLQLQFWEVLHSDWQI